MAVLVLGIDTQSALAQGFRDTVGFRFTSYPCQHRHASHQLGVSDRNSFPDSDRKKQPHVLNRGELQL
jgi:hypothetical protein